MDSSKLESVIEGITVACKRFVSKEIDFDGLREVFFGVPESLWSDGNAMSKIIEIPLYDDDIYDMAIDMNLNISDFVCELIPQSVWDDKDSIVAILDLLCDYHSECSECVGTSDFEAVFNHVTEEMWEDRPFAIKLVDKVTEWARGIYDLNCVDELIPSSFFKDEYDSCYVISSLCSANNMNAAEFYLFPAAAWQYPKAIIWILSNLEDELSGGGFTMYPVFGGSKRDYISSLIEYISDSFKSDKDFILEFLEHSYFSDAFDLIYDWIDQSLWADSEFAAAVLCDIDSDAFDRVPNELLEDEDFIAALEDSFDIYELGRELFDGGDTDHGIALMLRAAERGNEEAQFRIAEMYRNSFGGQNAEETAKLLRAGKKDKTGN